MVPSIQIGILSVLLTGFAPPSESRTDEPVPEAAEVITDDIMGVIDIVLAEHFAPPTRQEMLAAAIRAMNHTERLATAERIAEEARIANAVSTADKDQLRRLLFESVKKSDGGTTPELTAMGAFAVFSVVPAGGMIIPQKDHLVEEQLAANRYVGVGIALRSEEGRTLIQSVIPDGPCDRAGIPSGSAILEVDGWKASDNLTEVVEHLRGPEGTEVMLVIQRPSSDQREEFQLTRGVVPFKHVHAFEAGPPDRRIAVLHISRLTPSVPHELRAYAARAKDLAGIIIDLSTTHYGSIHDAVMTADALLDGGEMGSALRVKGAESFRLQQDAVFRDLPMQVIVSRQTQGTVEWLAAALIESGRATLYGEPTAGAAVARSSFELPSGQHVIDLATTVLIPKSGNRLMAIFDGRSAQPVISREVRKRPSPNETDLSHGRLIPAESATRQLPLAALETVFEAPNETRRKFIQDAVDHVVEKLAKSATVDQSQ